MRRAVFAGVLALCACLSVEAWAQQLDRAVFKGMAGELLRTVKSGQRIAVLPFSREDSAVSQRTADLIADYLTDALLKEGTGLLGGQNYTIVARAELAKVFAEAQEFHKSTRGHMKDKVDDILAQAKADVIVTGSMTVAPGGVQLSYKAIQVLTGHILGTATPTVVPLDLDREAEGQVLATTDAAVQAAIDHFARTVTGLRSIRRKGLYYQNSGIQTPFGREFESLVLAGLRGKVTNLDTSEAFLSAPEGRGGKVKAAAIDDELVSQERGEYLFDGSYWDVGSAVEVRVALRNRQADSHSWTGRLRKSAIPAAWGLAPTRDWSEATGQDNLGPIALYLSSNKGRNPSYHFGEKLHLLIQTDRDAHLYCFMLQSDGTALKLFPNRYHPRSRIAGDFLHTLPGKTMPFEIELEGPPSAELVKCFAIDHDVDEHLPDIYRTADETPFRFTSEKDLLVTFRAVPNIRITEASLIVNIVP